MKLITAEIDNETHRLLHEMAAEQGVSISAIAGRLLRAELLKSKEDKLRRTIRSFRVDDRLSRDDLHLRRGS